MQTAGSTAGTMTVSGALTSTTSPFSASPLTVTFTLNTPPSTSVAALVPTAMTVLTSTQCHTPAGFTAFNNLASV